MISTPHPIPSLPISSLHTPVMKFSITLLSLLATSAVSITAFQIPFPTKPAGGHQSPLTFANDMYLSSVGDDHVIAKHPAYPVSKTERYKVDGVMCVLEYLSSRMSVTFACILCRIME